MTNKTTGVQIPITAKDMTAQAFTSAERNVQRLNKATLSMNAATVTTTDTTNPDRATHGAVGRAGFRPLRGRIGR